MNRQSEILTILFLLVLWLWEVCFTLTFSSLTSVYWPKVPQLLFVYLNLSNHKWWDLATGVFTVPLSRCQLHWHPGIAPLRPGVPLVSTLQRNKWFENSKFFAARNSRRQLFALCQNRNMRLMSLFLSSASLWQIVPFKPNPRWNPFTAQVTGQARVVGITIEDGISSLYTATRLCYFLRYRLL